MPEGTTIIGIPCWLTQVHQRPRRVKHRYFAWPTPCRSLAISRHDSDCSSARSQSCCTWIRCGLANRNPALPPSNLWHAACLHACMPLARGAKAHLVVLQRQSSSDATERNAGSPSARAAARWRQSQSPLRPSCTNRAVPGFLSCVAARSLAVHGLFFTPIFGVPFLSRPLPFVHFWYLSRLRRLPRFERGESGIPSAPIT